MLDPIRHQLTSIMTAYGYNLYENKNRLRADDLLVREKAAEALTEAANGLRSLRTDYRRAFVPPPTRQNPDPPPERLADLRLMDVLQTRLVDLATRVRSMPVPTQDRVWERFRQEKTLLSDLLRHDYNLIAPAHELRSQIQQLTAASWDGTASEGIQRACDGIERSIRDRSEFLRIPGW